MSRTKLGEALAIVTTAGEKIAQADAGLARIDTSITADSSAAAELAAWNARETESYSRVARGEIPEILDYAERADIMKRMAEATSKRDAVERAKSQLQSQKRDAIVARDAAVEQLPLLAMVAAVDGEYLADLIETARAASVAQIKAAAALNAFKAVAISQAYSVAESLRDEGRAVMNRAISAINAVDIREEVNVLAEETLARDEILAYLADLQRAPTPIAEAA